MAPGDFEPDTRLVSATHLSPNINDRRGVDRPSILILHYTGLPTVERAIEVLADPVCQVSCHYVIDENGRITQMVPEDLRAWHAGVSYWQGHTDLNSMSVGIEIQNPGHDAGYPEFPDVQMDSVIALSKDITQRHNMRPEHVLAHSDIAPQRKNDPGEKFDWHRLYQAGIGHWVEPVPLVTDPAQNEASATQSKALAFEFQKLLRDYGYDCPIDGAIDDRMVKVTEAFQRHFRPARVDGHIDESSLQTLQKLHAVLGRRNF